MASYVYMLSKINVPVILKLGYIEFVMAGVRHSAIVNTVALTIAELMASA